MLKIFTKPYFLLLLSLFIIHSTVYGQVSSIVSGVKAGDATEGQDYLISLDLLQSNAGAKSTVFYRSFGESEFKQGEMTTRGTTTEYLISGERVTPPYLECYFVITLENGVSESYPLGAPQQNQPLQIKVLPLSPKDREVSILSPEKNKYVAESEFFVSISLLRASSSVDKAATKVYIDNNDVTANVLFAEDMLLFYADNFPQKFSMGKHTIRVELFDTDKKPYHSVVTAFNLVSDETATEIAAQMTYQGNAVAESRNENTNNVNTLYNSLDLNLSGNYKFLDVDARAYVTSEEKKYLQPNNRFSLNARTEWLQLSVGDHYPTYPSLVISGKRIRGVTGSLTLGAFNVISTYGEISRSVEGVLDHVYLPGETVPLMSNVIDVDSSKFGGRKALARELGTYSRKMFAVHPYFGRGESFQFGLTYMHSADDTKSIDIGARPQENVVLGTDLLVGIDDQHVLFTGQAAVSISNSDISTGNMTDDAFKTYLNSVDSTLDIMEYKTFLQKFMTVNQFIKPLNPQKFSTLASEAALSINYFNNYLKGSYIYRGSDYESFSNSYLRTNIAGVNFTDRLRLMENKLFLSLSLENLKDNLQKTAAGTTTFNTYAGAVSYYPSANLPGFMVSYFLSDNKNDVYLPSAAVVWDKLSPGKPDTSIVDPNTNDRTYRIMLQVSYDFLYFKRHQVSLSYSISERDDQTLYNNDAMNYSINLSTKTLWFDNLQTNFDVNISHSSLTRNRGIMLYGDTTNGKKYVTLNDPAHPTDELNIYALSFGGRYYMLDRKLNIWAGVNPTFGDFQRVEISTRSEYLVMRNFSLQLVLRYLVNNKLPSVVANLYNDSTVGLTARYNW